MLFDTSINLTLKGNMKNSAVTNVYFFASLLSTKVGHLTATRAHQEDEEKMARKIKTETR